MNILIIFILLSCQFLNVFSGSLLPSRYRHHNKRDLSSGKCYYLFSIKLVFFFCKKDIFSPNSMENFISCFLSQEKMNEKVVSGMHRK